MPNESVLRSWVPRRRTGRALCAAIVLSGVVAGSCTDSIPVTGPSPTTVSTVTVPPAQAQQPAPTLTSISPNSGSVSGGTLVTITGTNFPPQSANPALRIGNAPLTQVTVVNSTTMTGVTGPHAAGGPFDLELTFSAGDRQPTYARLGRAFTYAGPTLTSISPNSGSVLGGTPVTITGTNFPPQSANPTLTIEARRCP